MPFSCGMFVYKGVTSALTKRALGDGGGGGEGGRGWKFFNKVEKIFCAFDV